MSFYISDWSTREFDICRGVYVCPGTILSPTDTEDDWVSLCVYVLYVHMCLHLHVSVVCVCVHV